MVERLRTLGELCIAHPIQVWSLLCKRARGPVPAKYMAHSLPCANQCRGAASGRRDGFKMVLRPNPRQCPWHQIARLGYVVQPIS